MMMSKKKERKEDAFTRTSIKSIYLFVCLSIYRANKLHTVFIEAQWSDI